MGLNLEFGRLGVRMFGRTDGNSPHRVGCPKERKKKKNVEKRSRKKEKKKEKEEEKRRRKGRRKGKRKRDDEENEEDEKELNCNAQFAVARLYHIIPCKGLTFSIIMTTTKCHVKNFTNLDDAGRSFQSR